MSDGVPPKAYYLSTWRAILHEVLGWPSPQVEAWIQQGTRLKELDDPHDWYYHRPPVYWIRHFLIPQALTERLTFSDCEALGWRIVVVFEGENHTVLPLGTDWRPFREKVNAILSEYGEHLTA